MTTTSEYVVDPVYLLPRPKAGHCAAQCHELGLVPGHVIVSREQLSNDSWSEAKLTLLWLGAELAVWNVQRRTDLAPNWIFSGEQSDWTLTNRDWYLTLDSGELTHLVLEAKTPDEGLMTAMRALTNWLAGQNSAHVMGVLKYTWKNLIADLHAQDPVAYPVSLDDCLPFLFRLTDERVSAMRNSST